MIFDFVCITANYLKPKHKSMRSRSITLYSKYKTAALLALAGAAITASAQIPMATEGITRQGKWEVYGIGQYLNSDDINFNSPYGGHIKTKMDDTGLGGFGMGYHINDFVSLHGDLMFGGATFNANVPLRDGGTFSAKQDAFIQTGRFNIDYNIINRRITPFLTAGIGYQYTEVELQNVPPQGVWWWDPWYGWVYYYDHPHAWQTDFTWNAGGGVRWNVTDNIMVKALVGATWLEYGGSDGIVTQIEGIFSIGFSW